MLQSYREQEKSDGICERTQKNQAVVSEKSRRAMFSVLILLSSCFNIFCMGILEIPRWYKEAAICENVFWSWTTTQ